MSWLPWLEVAINGPWTRRYQPNIPISCDEIVKESVDCVEAGAAIVHVHAYDAETGVQRDDPDLYARIIEGVRAHVDAIVYPTVPFAAESSGPGAAGESARFGAIEELGRRGLLEWSVVDLGSLNFIAEHQLRDGSDGFVHTNTVAEIRHNLALAARFGFHPSYTIYEPGFLRLGSLMRRVMHDLPTPVYRLMFTDYYTFGYAPSEQALDDYLSLLRQYDPDAPWMVAGLGVDIERLLPAALERQGHIRVGLEDLPPGVLARNVDLVTAAANLVDRMGLSLAGAGEVRKAIENTPKPGERNHPADRGVRPVAAG